MKNQNSVSKERRSLRTALRSIIWKGLRHQSKTEHVSNVVGSGILRQDRSLPTIIQPSPASYLSNYADRFDIDQDESSIPDRFDVSSVATAVSLCQSLKPQMSMSSFDLQPSKSIHRMPFFDATHNAKPVRQRQIVSSFTSLPSELAAGASCHASLVTLHSLQPSRSTLRIRRSDQSLRSSPGGVIQHPSVTKVISRLQQGPGLQRKRSSISDFRQSPKAFQEPFSRPRLDHHDRKNTQSNVRFADLPSQTKTPSIQSTASNNMSAVEQFSSFCVLDAVTQGCPVTATSKELRYIFELGEQFCLNNHGCEGTSMDVVMGSDANGNPITHLVLFSPLVIPSSGRSRFMLASLVDVTDFIQDTASLPDLYSEQLDTISEEGSEISTPIQKSRSSPRFFESSRSIGSLRSELSADDLLGGCSVAEVKSMFDQEQDDIWKILATEERRRPPRSLNTGSRTPTSNTSSVSSVDDILDDFMNSLQELYSDFFLLAKSPLDDSYYEICNVSPRVYASKDYVHGHLSMTSTHDMMDLSTQLAYDEPFTMLVRWGTTGVFKQLYCIPLFARISTTWVCFLVDPDLPPLWAPPKMDR